MTEFIIVGREAISRENEHKPTGTTTVIWFGTVQPALGHWDPRKLFGQCSRACVLAF